MASAVKARCAICSNKDGGVYTFPQTILHLRALCEALHIKKPESYHAHPACVTRLTKQILKLRKKRDL